MEATDSQLSDAIRQGKMNDSQNDAESSRTAIEFSQNTLKAIANGEFLLPGLSPGGSEELEKTMKSPGMESVRKSIEIKREFSGNDLKLHVREEIMFSQKCSFPTENSNPPVLKRRTNRIEAEAEDEGEIPMGTSEDPDKSILFKSSIVLNESIDLFNLSSEEQPDENALLSQSFESNMTLTQRHLGSQDVTYLRERTAEEQEKHKLEKQRQKQRKSMQASGEPPVYTDLPAQGPLIHDPIPLETPDLGDRDVFADDYDDESMRFVGSAVEQKPVEINWMTMKVNMENQKRTSDFVYHDDHLWARMNVSVPIEVRWHVNSHQKLMLRVRLVHYDKALPMHLAIREPLTDVRKCRDHTEEEAAGYPPESFFYIHNSPLQWTFASKEEKLKYGFSFQTVVGADSSGINFDLKFRCQEKCMGLDERRKMMCFVVFLEDENGNSLIHSCLNEVRVVAYPRRDFKNYCEKAKPSKSSGWEFPRTRQLPPPPYHPIPYPSGGFQNCFQSDMHNVTNNPAFAMFSSSSRKRVASDMSHGSTSTMTSSCFSTSSRTNDYSVRMALGSSYKAEHIEPMDVFSNENEQASSSKKCRATHVPFTRFWVTEGEIEILAAKARADRSDASRFQSVHPHPLTLQSRITAETNIQLWLTTFRQGAAHTQFENIGIHTMADLMRAFENNPNIFETVGLDPKEVKQFYEVFLNFHRVYRADQLEHQRRYHPQ